MDSSATNSSESQHTPSSSGKVTLAHLAGVGLAVALVAIVVLALSLAMMSRPGESTHGWLIVFAVSCGVLLLCGAGALYANIRLLTDLRGDDRRRIDHLERIHTQSVQLERALELVGENILLSDQAKQLAFRQRESDAVRRAIEEEIQHGNWEGAAYLAAEIQRRFGYEREAAELRQRIDAAMTAYHQRQVDEHLAVFDKMLAEYRWSDAAEEMARLQMQFPDDPAMVHLPERLEQRRQQHKRQLLADWDAAVKRNDTDRSIEILTELDQYLTSGEADALKDSAREVFRTKLHNLGVRFSMLVSERNWTEALQVGREIVEEFPNSKMAAEVREHMEGLKSRATEASA